MSRRIEVLAEPKKDIVEKCIPRKPDFVLPDTFLPSWRRLPLSSKIPAKSNPDDPVNFTRPRLSKPLHRNFPKKDFDCSPRKDLPLDYNCLHDEHLMGYFCYNRRNYIKLVRRGVVEPFRDQVACTQAEFNHYREYMRSIIVQQEKLRRQDDEKKLRHKIETRQQEIDNSQRYKPLEYLMKKFRLKQKHKIKVIEELGVDYRPHFQRFDDDEDEYLAKFLKKRDCLRQDESFRQVTGEQEALRDFRHVTSACRKAITKAEKDKKVVKWWKQMEDSELRKMQAMDIAIKHDNEEFRQRVHKHEAKHEKIWAQYGKHSQRQGSESSMAAEEKGVSSSEIAPSTTTDEELQSYTEIAPSVTADDEGLTTSEERKTEEITVQEETEDGSNLNLNQMFQTDNEN